MKHGLIAAVAAGLAGCSNGSPSAQPCQTDADCAVLTCNCASQTLVRSACECGVFQDGGGCLDGGVCAAQADCASLCAADRQVCTACGTAADCVPVNCICGSSGQLSAYSGCSNGCCATECPAAQDFPAGASCGTGCDCASGACQLGLCCALPPHAASGTPCATNCDCLSGFCNGTSCL